MPKQTQPEDTRELSLMERFENMLARLAHHGFAEMDQPLPAKEESQAEPEPALIEHPDGVKYVPFTPLPRAVNEEPAPFPQQTTPEPAPETAA